MAFIRNSGGFVGIHAAVDTEHGWPWYEELVGAYFRSHPAPAQARVWVESRITLPRRRCRTLGAASPSSTASSGTRGAVIVLLTLDEVSYPGGQIRADHPVAWYHGHEGAGRGTREEATRTAPAPSPCSWSTCWVVSGTA
jgi:hypothetical protein